MTDNIQYNRDAIGNIKSVNVADMMAAQEAGMSVEDYVKEYGSLSQFSDKVNINKHTQPNPNHQWGKPSQHTQKDQDR